MSRQSETTQCRVIIDTTVEIVTSGYDDRFLRHNSSYTVHYMDTSPQFAGEKEAIHFLMRVVGMDFDTAWQTMQSAVRHTSMSGRPSPRESMSLVIADDDLRSIQALLDLRRQDRMTDAGREERHAILSAHPLSDYLRAIVDYQLSECDRLNIQTWGHPDGYYAAQKAAGLA